MNRAEIEKIKKDLGETCPLFNYYYIKRVELILCPLANHKCPFYKNTVHLKIHLYLNSVLPINIHDVAI